MIGGELLGVLEKLLLIYFAGIPLTFVAGVVVSLIQSYRGKDDPECDLGLCFIVVYSVLWPGVCLVLLDMMFDRVRNVVSGVGLRRRRKGGS